MRVLTSWGSWEVKRADIKFATCDAQVILLPTSMDCYRDFHKTLFTLYTYTT